MAEAQITTADPEIATRFERFLQQEGAIEAPTADKSEAAPAQPAKAEEAAAEPVADEAPGTEPGEAAPAAESETETDVETDDEESRDASAATEGDVDGIETFSDLAKAFAVDEQDLLDHIQIPSRDGDGTVSLSEAVSAYKEQPQETEESRLRFENLGQELQGEHDTKLGELQKITAALIAHIESEPNIDWDELRETDPGEYLKARETRDAKRADVERSLNAMDVEMARREEQNEKERDTWRSNQIETLYRLRPDWKEAENGRKAMTDVQDYLAKSGFPKEQIDALEDAKSILTVWRAAQWEKLQAKKPEVKKRLRLVPRMLRNTAREDAVESTAEQAVQEQRNALRQRLSESGSVNDAAALLEALKV